MRAARRTAGSLLAANQIGGRGFLDRADVHADVVEAAFRAVIAHAILGPKALDQFEIFFETLNALALEHAECIELDVAIAQPDSEK